MAREKPPEAGVPEWILTYGDMMSLLLCFFIMLFSMSTLQVVKIQAAIESLSSAFGYQGASMAPQQQEANATRPRVSATGRARRLDTMRGGQPVVSAQGENPKVQTIPIAEENVKGAVIRFPLGNDELSEQARRDLDGIYGELIGSPFKIMVKGHASPTEILGVYRDVDDLAYTRARNVRDYLVGLGLKQNYFQIVSVGASEPIPQENLPPGTDPKLFNCFVEIKLLAGTVRNLEGERVNREVQLLDGGGIPE